MRRVLTTLATIAILVGATAIPALADPTTTLVSFTNVYSDSDPCNGSTQVFTLNVTVTAHIGHNNNFVGRSFMTGTTDAGYIMTNHHETYVNNTGGERAHFKDVWRNPENGDKMEVSGAIRYVGNSAEIYEAVYRCVGAPTILP
jgi:hypothetical protein